MRKIEKKLRFNQCFCCVIQNRLIKYQFCITLADTDPQPPQEVYVDSSPIYEMKSQAYAEH